MFLLNNDFYYSAYDFEYVITLSDWYHERITELIRLRMAPNYGGFNVRIKILKYRIKCIKTTKYDKVNI